MTGSTTITREEQTADEGPALMIGGQPQPGDAGSYPIHNPARPAEIVGHAPAADRAQLDAGVAAARRAAPGWRALSVAERVAAFAASATTAAEQLAGRDGAQLYTREHGKVLTEAIFEISTGPGLAARRGRGVPLAGGATRRVLSRLEITGLVHQSHRRCTVGIELGDAQRRQVEVQPIHDARPGVQRQPQQHLDRRHM
jgi:hypothetical protein